MHKNHLFWFIYWQYLVYFPFLNFKNSALNLLYQKVAIERDRWGYTSEEAFLLITEYILINMATESKNYSKFQAVLLHEILWR